VLEKSPDSYDVHVESGIALDLMGDYATAREHSAIEVTRLNKRTVRCE
jgi:hypothetical protein